MREKGINWQYIALISYFTLAFVGAEGINSDHYHQRLLVGPIKVHGKSDNLVFSFTHSIRQNEVVIIIFDICQLKYYFG